MANTSTPPLEGTTETISPISILDNIDMVNELSTVVFKYVRSILPDQQLSIDALKVEGLGSHLIDYIKAILVKNPDTNIIYMMNQANTNCMMIVRDSTQNGFSVFMSPVSEIEGREMDLLNTYGKEARMNSLFLERTPNTEEFHKKYLSAISEFKAASKAAFSKTSTPV